MDARKREIRNLDSKLSFREATPDEVQKGDLGTISGRAIVFNAESEVLDEYGDTFREVILPEACTMEFLNTQDIKINMLHDRSLTFGRAKKGMTGNARLSVDEKGVNFDVTVPDCDLGIRARELTKAGVYDGCSFEFWPEEYDIEQREGDVPLVKHRKFRMVTALTLGMDPAYQQTTLSVREMVHREEEEEPEEMEEKPEEETPENTEAPAEAEETTEETEEPKEETTEETEEDKMEREMERRLAIMHRHYDNEF